MKEIKFRCWDGSKMLYWGQGRDINSLYCYGSIMLNNGHILFPGKKGAGPLELFTGLLDKNGVEIYEGDIVSGFKGVNAVIEWDEDRPRFVINVGYNKNQHKFSLTCDEVEYGLEVVGHIHANPELTSAGEA